jgi:DUF4097 and DUF4098 domain-containing protein YvlB
MNTSGIILDDGNGVLTVYYNGLTIILNAANAIISVTNGTNTINLDAVDGWIYLTGGGKSITAALADLPAGATAKFQACQVCVGGVLKTAYVLMTTPT